MFNGELKQLYSKVRKKINYLKINRLNDENKVNIKSVMSLGNIIEFSFHKHILFKMNFQNRFEFNLVAERKPWC